MLKRLLLLVMLLLSFTCCNAESDFPALDYLRELGYEPEYIDASPGWRTCNLMGGDGWWTLSISDEKDALSLMVLSEFDPMFDSSEIQALFVDLVQKFEWDVSFYWPDYDSGAKIRKSYNIVHDIDDTMDNYYDKSEYILALRNEFDLIDNPNGKTNKTESVEYTPEWLAETYNASSSDGFIVKAEYHSDLDVFTYSLQSTDITTPIWNACDAVVRAQYRDKFNSIAGGIKESLDKLGYTATTVVATFQLCDGNAIYMMIDSEDFTSMVSD